VRSGQEHEDVLALRVEAEGMGSLLRRNGFHDAPNTRVDDLEHTGLADGDVETSITSTLSFAV
jgi:hypothetical protein